MVGILGGQMGEDKADHGESSKPIEILTSSIGGKRKMTYFLRMRSFS